MAYRDDLAEGFIYCVDFVGRARDELRVLPDNVADFFGRQLMVAQQGELPPKAVSAPNYGKNTYEIKFKCTGEEYRLLYRISTKIEVIGVLMAIDKKSSTGKDLSLKDKRTLLARQKEFDLFIKKNSYK